MKFFAGKKVICEEIDGLTVKFQTSYAPLHQIFSNPLRFVEGCAAAENCLSLQRELYPRIINNIYIIKTVILAIEKLR